MLKDDMQRSYRIDIESNSTVDGDATTEKTEATEFMNSIGQAIAGLAPVAQMSPQGFEVVKKVMVELCKRYRMGSDLISLLDQMQPPPSTGQSPKMQAQADDLTKREEQVKKSEDQLKSQADGIKSQADQQKAQIDQSMTQLKQVEDQLQAKAMQISKDSMELDLQKQQLGLDVREAELQLKGAALQISGDAKKNEINARSIQSQKAAKPSAAPSAPATTMDPAIKELVKAITEQTSSVVQIAENMGKPVKITKTGPNTYTKE